MPPDETLSLSRDEMRALGYRVVDMLVEHFEGLREKRVTNKLDRATLEELLREPMPEKGTSVLANLERLERDVFANITHVTHPRFAAFVPSPSNFVAVMADALVSGFNVFAGTWIESSGPSVLELVTIDWLREACGMPDTAGGLFVSGGSVANITGLAVARHVKLGDNLDGAVAYFSDQAHSAVERGLRVLGFHSNQLRKLKSDETFRLNFPALQRAIQEDREAGRMPFCIVANAGTVNTGAVDPLEALADYCEAEGLWLHVDGAYGAAAVFCDRGRALLKGLDRADSLALDPHKWLFQPYEIGCVLVREAGLLKDTFQILPEYLEDTRVEKDEVNFADYGIQLTRNFRALKLWMSLKVFGASSFAKAISRGFELAQVAETELRKLPDWEIVTPAQMGIVSFRYAPNDKAPQELDILNRKLIKALFDDGFAMVSSTKLRGRIVLRMCPINPRATEDDVKDIVRRLDELSRDVGGGR